MVNGAQGFGLAVRSGGGDAVALGGFGPAQQLAQQVRVVTAGMSQPTTRFQSVSVTRRAV